MVPAQCPPLLAGDYDARARSDRRIPTHDAPATPLHDSIIPKSEARLRRPTLTNHVQNPGAAPWTPKVQYAEIFAGVGSTSSAVETRGCEIDMLTEKEPTARENLRRHFLDTTIHGDIDND